MLDHHERLDGSGYPRGLGAPDLDIETRILAVCDVFDALLSKRVYRPAWTLEKALELLSEGVRHQLRPGLRRGARACDRARAGPSTAPRGAA